MKKETALWIAGGAALWYFVLRGISAVQFRFLGLGLVSATAEQLDFRLSLAVRNPLLVGVVVNHIAGDIYIGTTRVGVVDYPLNRRVERRGITYLSFQFTAYTRELGQALVENILTGDVRTLTVRFTGQVTVEGRPVAIDRMFLFEDLVRA